MDTAGDGAREGGVKYDHRLPGHTPVGEDEAATVRPNTALQVSHVTDGVHSLVLGNL